MRPTEDIAAQETSTADGQVRLTLDVSSFVPFYEQIAGQVRALVRQGSLKVGETFLSEGEIATRLGISKMPVRQAFQKLRTEGLLVVARGKKPIIGAGHVPWNFQQLRGFSEEMRRRGLEPSAKVLAMELREPDPETIEALRLESGEKIYRLRRLRYIDRQPVAVVTSFLPARIFPELEKHDLSQSLYRIMETSYRLKLGYAEDSIGAVGADAEVAQVLQTVAGAALLQITETTFDAQKIPLEYSISLLRGDRYTASVVSVRPK